jgi:phosphohistidine phosphatase SixA
VSIYLVRHAKAGARRSWSGDDDLRPLSKPGRRQALALGDSLADAGITRIVSSPFVRCRQTVAPLGDRLRLTVEVSDALAEGAPQSDSLRLVEKHLDMSVALCSHGDVLGKLLNHFAHGGATLDNDRLEKASVWVLDVVDSDVRTARYLPPPPV